MSDAAFVRYDPANLGELGYIARTTGSGSRTIDIWHPRFVIAEEDGWLLVGTRVDKIGRTTGWTWGEVTETCVDVPGWFDWYFLARTSLLCQTEANYGSGGGDSGGPVFTWPLDEDEVALRGIHVGWHMREDGWVGRLFSNWTLIALEIGADAGPLTAIRP